MASVTLTGATTRSLSITPSTGQVKVSDLLAGDVVGIAQIEVTTAFNGSPTVELGITGDLDLVIRPKDVKLKKVGTYVVTALFPISATDELFLTLVAGGATVGAAELTVVITRES